MSKHLDNLKRICDKLSARFGKEDDLVLQLQKEIEARELKESKKVERRKKKVASNPRSGVVTDFESHRES
jgi:hypothetical protein